MSKAIMLESLQEGNVVNSGTFVATATGYKYSFDVGKTADEYDYLIINNMSYIYGETVENSKFLTRFINFLDGYGYWIDIPSGSNSVRAGAQSNITAARWSVTRSGTTVSCDGYSNAPQVKEGETYRWMIWKEQR